MAMDQIMPNKRLAALSKAEGAAKTESARQPNQKIPIVVKGPIYMRTLAELMSVKVHHVAQDLQRMKIFTHWDQKIDRHVAEKICKRRGFALK